MNFDSFRALLKRLTLAITVFMFLCICFAEDMDALIKVPIGGFDAKLMDAKAALYENGYYPDGFDVTMLENATLDDWTMNALANLADANPNIPAYNGHNEGMTNRAYWDLTQRPPQVRSIATPVPRNDSTQATYHDIDWDGVNDQEGSAAVERVQQRLIMLGYLDINDPGYEPRKLTYSLLDTVHAFLERNNRLDLYDKGGIITVPIQELLFSEGAIPNEIQQPGLPERLRMYFLGSSTVLGFRLPTLLVLVIGLALIIACIVAFIHFFSTPAAARPNGDSGKASGKKGEPILHFDIKYNGKRKQWDRAPDPVLKIGRNVGQFPLDHEDKSISREHCELSFRDGKLFISDTSSYGTRLNGELFNNDRREVHKGDIITIGAHKIKINW